ncbi:antA/AntB antirepressor family protein [Spirosoma litoris]
MNELIQITTNEQGLSVVSARELHAFLEVRTRFNDWIKARIIKYSFRQDTDYVEVESFTEFSVKGGRPETEYALTLDMAKELAMVENNHKGREARLYFIEKEKQLRQVLTSPTTEQVLIQLIGQSNQLLANQQKMLVDQQQAINQLRADVNTIMSGYRPPKNRLTPRLVGPPKKAANPLRQLITRKVNDYCAIHEAEQSETYRYLYRRIHEFYGIDVYRLVHLSKQESHLDVLERYGHLEKLYGFIMSELHSPEE